VAPYRDILQDVMNGINDKALKSIDSWVGGRRWEKSNKKIK
jgi:hypothetical protein